MAQITQIIPTYNMRDTVFRTIESCLNQTVKAPLIVIDDGSTDGTYELIIKKYNRGELFAIRINNKGMAGAMNYALRYVETPYFVFTGADDVVDKDNIKNWMSCELSDVNYSHIGIKPVSPDKILPNIRKNLKNSEIRHCHQFYTDDGRHIVDGINCLCLRTDMVKYEKFDENLRHKEGGELIIRLALLGYEFKYFDFIGGYRDKFGKSTNSESNTLAIEYIKNKFRDFNIS